MSKKETKRNRFLSKDGLWYRDYQSAVEANKRHNQNHLRKLGLDKSFMDSVKPKKSPKKKRPAPSPLPVDLRRSKRMRSVTPDFFDGLPHSFVDSKPKPKRIVPRPARTTVSEEDRALLKDLPNWLDEMENFLLTVPHGNAYKVVSRDNCRSVMRQVKRMVSGIGITYHHWNGKVAFKKGIKIHLGMDFNHLYQEAVSFENEHGRDLGNGWLMRHPIVKLQCYQEYCRDNKGQVKA